jgi:hypothetical protein
MFDRAQERCILPWRFAHLARLPLAPDEGGVSFWLPGLYGSLAPAAAAAPPPILTK